MSLLKEVKYLVVHCTATRLSQRVSVEDIDRWHKAQGWSGIGYHWYVDRDGHIFPGRSERVDLKQSYPNAIVLGHRDFPGVHKDCPCFDAKTEYSYIQ